MQTSIIIKALCAVQYANVDITVQGNTIIKQSTSLHDRSLHRSIDYERRNQRLFFPAFFPSKLSAGLLLPATFSASA